MTDGRKARAVHLAGGRAVTVVIAVAVVLGVTSLGRASHPLDGQAAELRALRQSIWTYHLETDRYPTITGPVTWYEQLVAADVLYVTPRTSPDGNLPLDYYGHPLVYEPPSPANGHEIVIRSVGKNGIDEHGAGDDWDIRYGPNFGHWHYEDWPAARRRALICGMLAAIGAVMIYWRMKAGRKRRIAVSTYLGVLSIGALPWGFDRLLIPSSASIDPAWISGVAILGTLLLLVAAFEAIPAAMVWTANLLWPTPPLPEGQCASCGYDLRGLRSAGVRRCPECGQPFELRC